MANRPVKIKSLTRIPARLVGTNGITIAFANGIYTVSLTDEAGLAAILAYVAGALRIVTAAGGITVTSVEPGIAVNKTAGAATTVQLPTAASRVGLPVIIKDMKKDANTNNITVLPNVADTLGIDGNATDIININGGVRTYRPITGGWLKT